MNDTFTLFTSGLIAAFALIFILGPTGPSQQALGAVPRQVRRTVAKAYILRHLPLPMWGAAGAALCCEFAGMPLPGLVAACAAFILSLIDLFWLTRSIVAAQEQEIRTLAAQALARCRRLDAAGSQTAH